MDETQVCGLGYKALMRCVSNGFLLLMTLKTPFTRTTACDEGKYLVCRSFSSRILFAVPIDAGQMPGARKILREIGNEVIEFHVLTTQTIEQYVLIESPHASAAQRTRLCKSRCQHFVGVFLFCLARARTGDVLRSMHMYKLRFSVASYSKQFMMLYNETLISSNRHPLVSQMGL